MKYTQEEVDNLLAIGEPVYCYNCNKKMDHTFPRLLKENHLYCGDCSFIKGFIDEKEYIENCLYWFGMPNVRIAVKDGEIFVVWGKKKFDWEKTNKEMRHSTEYSEWRNKVFKRDNYTCQICGQTGGDLNAHHKKSFKNYPKQRLNVNNGITLCIKCHKKVHKGEIHGLYTS